MATSKSRDRINRMENRINRIQEKSKKHERG
jgi:hypothetical protein